MVPVLNEAALLPEALRRLRGGADEVIVVDGGSGDGSPELAKPFADQVLCEGGGLATQLNRGAAASCGDVLFFPYADTEFPQEWASSIRATLADARVAGGAFRLGFSSSAWRYRVIAAAGNWRSALGVGPLGDQGLFVRRQVFEVLGGFRSGVLLEDLDFVRRLRRHGRVRIASAPVRTSTRRWEHGGVVATTIRNWSYLVRHLLGRHGCKDRSHYHAYRGQR